MTEVVCIGVLQADPSGEGRLVKGLKQSINVETYGAPGTCWLGSRLGTGDE